MRHREEDLKVQEQKKWEEGDSAAGIEEKGERGGRSQKAGGFPENGRIQLAERED